MEKTIIFFDIDGTLFDNYNQMIHPSTKALIHQLSQIPHIDLAIATGRSIVSLDVIEEFLPYFPIKILINGSITMEEEHIIHHRPLDPKRLDAYVEAAEKQQLAVGFIGEKDVALTQINDIVIPAIEDFKMTMPPINRDFHHQTPVYQAWLFCEDDVVIDAMASQFTDLNFMKWYARGADVTQSGIHKGHAIQEFLKLKPYKKVIAVGDGENDVDMLKVVDIGIAMGNTRFEPLREAADYIAEPIDQDGLAKIFKQLGITQ